MVFRTRRQRPGRLFHWVTGALILALLGIGGYQWWINRERIKQRDEAVEKLQSAQLSRVESKADDWKPNPLDWPQWRGVHRDAIAPAQELIQAWPAGGPPVLWRADGGGGFSSLAIADGRLVTLVQDSQNEVVLCIATEEKDGKKPGEILWRFPYESYFTQDGVGPRATPTIHGDHVYTLGALGHLRCLEVRTGKEVWHKDLQQEFGAPLPKWGYSFSPLVEGDLLLTQPGAPGASLIAFDRKSGDVRWKKLDDAPGYSSPVVSEACGVRQALFFTGDALVSVEPKSGTPLWRFPWETKFKVNAATPIALGNYVFISSGYGKGCGLVEVVKKDDGTLEAEEVYTNNLMRNHFSSSVFFGDHLYGFDEGYLTCIPFRLDERKGARRAWKERKFNRGTVLVAGDKLIVLGEEGSLALVEPTPSEYREKANFKVTNGRCWSAPALARGLLYVRDEKQIMCLDLRKK